eukprot:1466243-Pleurochrysis_carterae.AAC.1
MTRLTERTRNNKHKQEREKARRIRRKERGWRKGERVQGWYPLRPLPRMEEGNGRNQQERKTRRQENFWEGMMGEENTRCSKTIQWT